MKPATMSVAFLSMLVCAVSLAAAPKLPAKPGNWQLTLKVDSAGLPMKLPPMTVEQCLTEADMVPKTQPQNQTCQPANPKINGNKVTWTIDCVDKNGATTKGTGKATYTSDSLEGSMEVMTMNLKLHYTLSGRRLGDCQKPEVPAQQ